MRGPAAWFSAAAFLPGVRRSRRQPLALCHHADPSDLKPRNELVLSWVGFWVTLGPLRGAEIHQPQHPSPKLHWFSAGWGVGNEPWNEVEEWKSIHLGQNDTEPAAEPRDPAFGRDLRTWPALASLKRFPSPRDKITCAKPGLGSLPWADSTDEMGSIIRHMCSLMTWFGLAGARQPQSLYVGLQQYMCPNPIIMLGEPI